MTTMPKIKIEIAYADADEVRLTVDGREHTISMGTLRHAAQQDLYSADWRGMQDPVCQQLAAVYREILRKAEAHHAAAKAPWIWPPHHWHTSPADQGRIVEISRPQQYGAAEGTTSDQVRSLDLILKVDHSDRSWSVASRGRVVMRGGPGESPSVAAVVRSLCPRS